jgi:hypothetical protein
MAELPFDEQPTSTMHNNAIDFFTITPSIARIIQCQFRIICEGSRSVPQPLVASSGALRELVAGHVQTLRDADPDGSGLPRFVEREVRSRRFNSHYGGGRAGGCARCMHERRVTPHGLRHTANNELRRVANGEVVRAIIGHATEAMTHHYSHVGKDEKREAVARVFAIVKGDERVVSRVVDGAAPDDHAVEVTELVGGAAQI